MKGILNWVAAVAGLMSLEMYSRCNKFLINWVLSGMAGGKYQLLWQLVIC